MMSMFDKAYTFDDVLLVPGYSDILPREVDLSSRITRKLWLKVPFISAAMDTVTEAEMARAMALMGGMGVIHKNLSIEGQAEQVERVKKAPVDRERYPLCSLDSFGRLMVGAAVGTGPGTVERIEAVVRAGIDVLAIDTAHGHSKRVIDLLSLVRELYPSLQIIAGNVVTSNGTRALIEAGADAVKVGIGPGSICTTRIVAGVGYPQLSAVMECSQVARERDIPIISDGGIRYSGDIVKALAAGASSVMMGNVFAGTKECPGKSTFVGGGEYKSYRGMGSFTAMAAGSSDRYFQDGQPACKLVAEGVEGMVRAKGSVEDVFEQLAGGVRSGFGYCGAASVEFLQSKRKFVQITAAGMVESHPHDITTF